MNNQATHISKDPWLTIIIASGYSIGDLERCLSVLALQAVDRQVEIIVADCCQDESLAAMMARYPRVQFIRFGEKVTLPMLWGAGIKRAKGQVIAITDSTCEVDSHWVSAIEEAHQTSGPVIGGSVEINGRTRTLVDWAAYFCEYSQFMKPLRNGVVQELPGNNISFKRSALEKGREFTRNGFWKTYWCRTLQEEGIELVSAPSIVVYYNKSYELGAFLVRRFHHGRCFAGMRVSRVAIPTRACYVVGTTLLPFIFMLRVVRVAIAKRRHLSQFILSLPITLLAILSWSVGEFCGYLVGTGKSCSYIF